MDVTATGSPRAAVSRTRDPKAKAVKRPPVNVVRAPSVVLARTVVPAPSAALVPKVPAMTVAPARTAALAPKVADRSAAPARKGLVATTVVPAAIVAVAVEAVTVARAPKVVLLLPALLQRPDEVPVVNSRIGPAAGRVR